jgi:hypothetical protein
MESDRDEKARATAEQVKEMREWLDKEFSRCEPKDPDCVCVMTDTMTVNDYTQFHCTADAAMRDVMGCRGDNEK